MDYKKYDKYLINSSLRKIKSNKIRGESRCCKMGWTNLL